MSSILFRTGLFNLQSKDSNYFGIRPYPPKAPPSAPRSVNLAGGAFSDGPGAEPGFFRDEGDGAVLEEEAGDAGRTGASGSVECRAAVSDP